MMVELIAGNLIAIEKVRFSNYQVIILTSINYNLIYYTSIFLRILTFFLN